MKKMFFYITSIFMVIYFAIASFAGTTKTFELYINGTDIAPYATAEMLDDSGDVTCPVPSDDKIPKGMKFAGWYDDPVNGELCLNKDFVSGMLGTTTATKLYAHFEPNVYKIIFKYTDGSDDKIVEVIYEKYGDDFYTDEECNDKLTDKITKISLDKYIFNGYKIGDKEIADVNGAIKVSADYFENDTDVYANLIQKVVKITKLKNDGTNDTDGEFYEKYGEGFYKEATCSNLITKFDTVPKRDGYSFIGYYKEPSAIRKYTNEKGEFVSAFTVDEFLNDTNIYACWKTENRKINLYMNDGTATLLEVLYGKGTDYYNDFKGSTAKKKVSIPQRPGYEFKGYFDNAGTTQYINGKGEYLPELDNFEGDLFAKWDIAVYEIRLMKNDNSASTTQIGSIFEKYSVDFYAKASDSVAISSVTPPTRIGYDFNGYYDDKANGTCYIDKDGNFDSKLVSTVFLSSSSLYAHWIADVSLLTLNRNDETSRIEDNIYVVGDGSVRQTLNGEEVSSVTIPVRSGYDFLGYVLYPEKVAEGDDLNSYIPTTNPLSSLKKLLFGVGNDPVIVIDKTGKPTANITKATGNAYAVWKTTPIPPAPTPAPTQPSSGTKSSGSTGGSGGSGGKDTYSSSGLDNNLLLDGKCAYKGSTMDLGWSFDADKQWRYYITSLQPVAGWLLWNSCYYYLDPNNSFAMSTGYRLINKVLYCFKPDGTMYQNEYINDVYVSNAGKIVEVAKYANTSKVEYVKEKNIYKLYGENNMLLEDCFTSYKGDVYILDTIDKSDYSTIMCGGFRIGDVVLYFDYLQGGKLSQVLSVQASNLFLKIALKTVEGNDARDTLLDPKNMLLSGR